MLVLLGSLALLWTPMLSARPTPERPQPARACPPSMVDGGGTFCIDTYEAHIVLPEGSVHPFYRPVEGSDGYRAESRRGVYPQAHISREQASAACQNAGKRLCTSTEWQKACRGPEPTAYPYGVRRRDGYCNDHGVAPLPILFRREGLQYGAHTMNDPRLNRVPGTLSPTGRFGRCTNSYGVFDMVGNLHEWVADASGVLRGGYYLDTDGLGEGCAYRAVGHAPAYRDYSTGFRCCADVK